MANQKNLSAYFKNLGVKAWITKNSDTTVAKTHFAFSQTNEPTSKFIDLHELRIKAIFFVHDDNVWCNFKSCCWRMTNTLIPTSHLHQLLESSKLCWDWRPGPSKIPTNRCRDKQLRLTTSIWDQISSKPLSPLPWISCFFPPLISCLLCHVSSAASFIGDEKSSNRIWLLSTSISQSFSIKNSHTVSSGII